MRAHCSTAAVAAGVFVLFSASTLLAAGGPLQVGHERQLFIDGRFQEKSQGIELRAHPAVKTGERTIDTDRPWETGGIGPYSSVLKDGDTYRMWYHAMSTTQWDAAGKDKGAVCYAESKDGVRWTKPDLGVIEFEGSRKNNIVVGYGASGITLGQDGGMVFLDPSAPSDQKFRFAIPMDEFGKGIHIFSSPDGIHWKLTHRSIITARPEEKNHHLDSQNVIFYDERLGKYVAYVRKNVKTPGSQGRSIARAESSKLGDFPVVQDMPVVLGPDAADGRHGDPPMVDYYMSAAVRYPWAADVYVMFPTAYYHYIGGGILPEFKGDIPVNAGPLDTQFAASRDGIRWERYGREPFVPLGMKGEFDWASARTIRGIVPDVSGHYLYLYYRASDWLHGWDRNEKNKKLLTEAGLGADQNIAVLSRVVLRRDGFVSLRAAYAGGEFTTPPLVFDGNRLVLNVDTSAAGVVRVEIQEAGGEVIKGYSLTDCGLIHTANDVSRLVSWRGGSDLKELAGRPVRLRFVMQDADLYAFEFAR